jgi:hypothetical protein
MAIEKIQFAPGIHKEGTQYSAGPTWFDCDKVRFRKGKPESIGGWLQYTTSTVFPFGDPDGEITDSFRGVPRSLFDWGTAGKIKYLGVGTNLKFYVEVGGVMNDITPLRSTTAAGDVTFAAVDGDATITVSDTAHGAVAGDYVTYSGAATLGDQITAAVLNHEYEIATIVDADSYTIEAVDSGQTPVLATATDSGNGGASVIGYYQINSGTNNYIASTGYGSGAYGSGSWGGSGSLSFAGQLRLWSQDSFGDDLVFNPRGGNIYFWDETIAVEGDGVDTRAVELADLPGATSPPTIALQVMTSSIDKHVIAFGCNDIGSSTSDPLLIRWCDQENIEIWTPTATNTAGGRPLSSGTEIIGAIKTRHEILVFTDTTIHSMRFSGAPYVYQFSPVAENVSVISPRAMISAGDYVFFMDMEGFYVYEGSVQRLECSVLSHVFSNLDKSQAFKIYATNNSDDSEVTWFYPAGDPGSEVNRYVTFNYQENHWTIGTFARGAWIEASTKTYPIAGSNDTVNVKTNYLYNHEYGYDANGSELAPYIESGMVEIGSGNSFMFIDRFIPDFRVDGLSVNADFTVIIKATEFPQEAPVVRATKTVTSTTKQSHVRVRGREMMLRIEASGTGYGWTMGDFRFDMRTDGRR